MDPKEKVNILLVDDVPANLVALEAIIERPEINICTANSGNEALKLAWEKSFAIALIDVQMPGMDGFELVELLKSHKRTREILCIFVTAISKEPKYAVRGLKAGAIDYLYKPLDPMVTNAKIGTYLDMYRQKNALVRLNENLENYALRVENAADIISLISPTSLKILEINSAVTDILGQEPRALLGTSFLDMIHPKEVPGIRSTIDQFLADQSPSLAFEARFRNTRHDYIWLQVQLIHKHGYLFANSRDISAQKQMIRELVKAKDRAEFEKRSKEEFLANMSHEIRTPMNGIIGLTRLLRDSQLSEEQSETVSLIFNSSNSLLNIINDILDLSKIESGKFHFEQIDFQIVEVVKMVQSLIQPKAEEKEIKLGYNVVSDVPLWLIGDPHRLSQVLINLVGNAVKFTSRGHVMINISTEKETKENVVLKIAVEDTGIGIPKEKVDLIFDAFSQAESATTRKFGGTGLGLTISRKLVQMQDGSIHVESKMGKGSTFYFFLPYKKSKKVKNKEEKSKTNPFELKGLEGKKVLLVDDNKVNRLVGRKTLKRWNMEVTLAEDGELAIEITKKSKFDIILMDLQMPKVDGYEAAVEIRKEKNNPNHETPIIALTANVMGSVVERSSTAGMDSIQTKPFDPFVLFDIMFRLITDGRSTLPLQGRKDVDKIDLAYLRQLSGGSQQFVLQYMRTFLGQIPKLREEMEEAIQSYSYHSFREIIQKVKQDFIYIDYEAAKEIINKLDILKQEDLGTENTHSLLRSFQGMVENVCEKFRELLEVEELTNKK